MKKLVISPVDRATSQKMIRQYLHNFSHHKVLKDAFGDHVVKQSELQWYVKAGFWHLEVFGSCQATVNKFLKDRMIVGHFFVPTINCLVVEEMLPDPLPGEIVVHRISFDTGTTNQVELTEQVRLTEARVKGVRTNTTELIVQSESSWEWFLFDLLDGKTRPVYTGGNEFYLSADGNFFFAVANWSQIGLVDLVTGIQLDAKNKRHFSRYATRVKIINVIHFDPERLCLFVLLMKKQDLSFTSLKNEVCIRLMVTD